MGLVQPDGLSPASAPGGANHRGVRLQLFAEKRDRDVGAGPVLLVAGGPVEKGHGGVSSWSCCDEKPTGVRRRRHANAAGSLNGSGGQILSG